MHTCFSRLPPIPIRRSCSGPSARASLPEAEAANPFVGCHAHLKWEHLLHAMTIFNSRSFYSTGLPGGRISPVDLANIGKHDKVNTRWYFDGAGNHVLDTARKIEAGEEILIMHCRKCNNERISHKRCVCVLTHKPQ